MRVASSKLERSVMEYRTRNMSPRAKQLSNLASEFCEEENPIKIHLKGLELIAQPLRGSVGCVFSPGQTETQVDASWYYYLRLRLGLRALAIRDDLRSL